MQKESDIPPIFTKVIGVILVLGFGFMVFSHFNKKHKFQDDNIEKAIITGVITDFNAGARNAPDFDFEFEVDGKRYEGSYTIVTALRQKSTKELRQYIGKKYRVWYVVEDPTDNKLLLDRPVE